MFSVRNVAVVIEPGVGALEAEFYTDDPVAGQRTLPVHLQRLPLNEALVEDLPLIPSTKLPHIFSLSTNLKQSNVLLVYDFLGRLSFVYTRSNAKDGWVKNDVAAEHAGKTVTQFSVRFNFSSAAERTKFLKCIDKLTTQSINGDELDQESVKRAVGVLARSRTAPVIMPIAVQKSAMRGIKL